MMRVTVSDGLNTARPEIFHIRIKDVFIHLVRNNALDVFPMMQTPLTSEHLLVTPSDQSDLREIVYRVKRPPSHGRLLYKDPTSNHVMLEVKNFTQSQLNSSSILYEHFRPFANLTIFDAVNLEAMADYAVQRLEITFHIKISVTAMIPGGIDRFIGTDNIRLEEGKREYATIFYVWL